MIFNKIYDVRRFLRAYSNHIGMVRGFFWRSAHKVESIFKPFVLVSLFGTVFFYFFNQLILLNENLFFRVFTIILDLACLYYIFFKNEKKNILYLLWYLMLISNICLQNILVLENFFSIISLFYWVIFVTALAICIDRLLIIITLNVLAISITYWFLSPLFYFNQYVLIKISIVWISVLPYWIIIKKSEFDKNRYKKEWMNNLLNLFANEARTPLRTISSYSVAIYNYLPKLIDAYKLAENSGLPVKKVYQMHLDILSDAVTVVNEEINTMFLMIDMALMKLTYNPDEKFEKFNAKESVLMAIECYGISREAKKLIKLDLEEDFQFKVSKTQFLHVMFNLLKNALYYVKAANRGEISIVLRKEKEWNVLIFTDTALGIEAEIKPYIFDEFFTTGDNRIGLGLSFCKMAMKKFNGDIFCDSIHGKYTTFKLLFPKV